MNESVVERIKKLLRLAQSSNRHEAELALARAFELAQKHQIDVSTLDLDDESEKIMHEWFNFGGRVEYLNARAMGIVITFFNVSACLDKPRVVFVGSETDIAIARYVYEFIVAAGKRQLRDFENDERSVRRRMTPNKRRGFYQGFIYGISRQLTDRRKQMQIEDGGKTAIVLVEKQRQRDELLAEVVGGKTKTIVHREMRKNLDALWSGYVAGSNTKINKPLSGTREAVLALE